MTPSPSSCPLPPNAATLALLQKHHPGVPLDELVVEYHQIGGVLPRHIRGSIFEQLNGNMIGALVSFIKDIGWSDFDQSTLRHRINAGRFLEAAAEFLKWTLVDRKPSRVKARQRAEEAALFCSFPS